MNLHRVLFVIPYLYEGGAQRALSNVQMHFPNDWEIDTLVNSDMDQKYPVRGNLYSLQIDETPKTDSLLFQFRAFVKRIRKLRELKKQKEYVACISFLDSANVANILTRTPKVKTIVSVRNSLASKSVLPQFRYIVNPLVKLLYNKSDYVVAVSEELRSELIKQFGISESKAVSITNGFDIEQIRNMSNMPLPDELRRLISGKRVILAAGRLAAVKCHINLIRAFSEVVRVVPNSVLIIVGSGPLAGELRRTSTDLGLDDCVIMPGHVDNVYTYLKAADVYVITSLYEGFPNSLGEAMCVGVPCIATDFRTGSREIIAPELMHSNVAITSATECEYGLLTPCCSSIRGVPSEQLELEERELAGAIIRILSDDALWERYHRKSIERSMNMDIMTCVDKWIRLMTE